MAPGVACFIQYGSESIRAYAEAQGYDALFREVGATVIAPSCGACINAGPGASKDAGTVITQFEGSPSPRAPDRARKRSG